MSVLLKPTGTLVTARPRDEIKLERGIPVPLAGGRPRQGPHLAVQRAMEAMDIEESFISPLDSKATLAIAKTVRLRTGRRFATRTMTEHGVAIVRVWRLK